jgi:outer membrane protein assembly factor BamE (lipoprotein component of BamABCDE complex)
MIQRVILMVIAIAMFLSNISCATLESYDSLNNMTKEEIIYELGTPERIYTDSFKAKYGADEIWFYRARFGATTRFYFKDNKVVGESKKLKHKVSKIETKDKTKKEIIDILGDPTAISEDPSQLKYDADEVWIYQPGFADTYIYFKDDTVVKKERKWRETL